MKVQLGKSYRNRRGERVNITRYDGNLTHPYYANDYWYGVDGQIYNGEATEWDLIAEWQDIDLTQITTPFGLLDEEAQKALKAHEGGIEVYAGTGWERGLGLYWIPTVTYRAKPEPKRETFTGQAYGNAYGDSRCPFISDTKCGDGIIGKWSAEVVDGKPVRIVWEASE